MAAADTAAPVATTPAGPLRGSAPRPGVVRFGGIPFAAPPVGERRFRPPAPAEPWEGELDATGFGPQAPQRLGGMEQMFGGSVSMDEGACLTLNVWAPAAALEPGARPRPVLFWIHGGGYVTGSGSTPWYDGSNLVERGDVLVVTTNYRMGALGFADLEGLGGAWEGTGAVNVGLLDQVAALRWVQENIAGLGGDPQRVTIFGESAGGGSVVCLLAMPAARGLFQRAIAQSPCVDEVKDRVAAGDLVTGLLDELGLTAGATPADLAAVPLERILDAQAAISARGGAGAGLAWVPTTGTASLPHHPRRALVDGPGPSTTAHDVPLLIGTTKDEIRLFQVMAAGAYDKTDDAHAAKALARQQEADPTLAEALVATYRAGRPEASATELYVDSQTDATFRIPSIEVAEARAARGAPTWMYRFDWPTPAFGGVLGACHAIEIPFAFDNLDQRGVDMFLGPDGPGDAEAKAALAAEVSGAWLSFATSEDPGAGPGWPRYEPDARTTRLLDAPTSTTVDDPAGDVRLAWAPLRTGG